MSKIVIDARILRTSTGRYVERLLHYLQKIDKKNQYTVLLKPADIEGWKPTANNFTKLVCPYKEFTFSEQTRFLKQIRDLQADLVFFPMAQQPILYWGKVVTTLQDLTTVRFRNPYRNWLVFTIKQHVYKWVNKVVARKSHAIITPSEFVKDDIARFTQINSRKITVTYEAADAITDSPKIVEELENKKYIMYVGRPTPHKNLPRLIEAFEKLRQQQPGLYLVLAGKKDSLYRSIEKSVRSRALQHVVFTGFVEEGELRWLYENTLAYVFPSLSEGFGLPGLEAMTHKAPVVASNATCLPEIYGDAAEYFDPLSVDDMSAAIGRVLSDPKLATALRGKGSKQVSKYSWQRMAEQTLAVFNDALGN